jgi:Ser/Thr protein kinase RdoA (MazF antagonist)
MEVLALGYDLAGTCQVDIKKLDSGRVNETYLVILDDGESYILQKLNSFFGQAETVGENWHRVGLALSGIKVGFPKITASKTTGWLYHSLQDGSVWRLTGFLPGRPPAKESPEEACLSAQTLGLCHVALNVPKPIDLTPIDLYPPLGNIEFTNQKRCEPADFEIIFTHYRGHPHLESLKADIERGADAARQLPGRPSFIRVFSARDLVIHRDCKLDNFLLDPELQSIIDWDTVGYGDPLLDLGEMCRSWAVSKVPPFYNAELAAAIVDGYRRTGLALSRQEYQLLPSVVRGLALNLARRYLIDALAEAYFRWDKDAYPSLYEQNMSRGQHMLDLAEELLNREIELMNI